MANDGLMVRLPVSGLGCVLLALAPAMAGAQDPAPATAPPAVYSVGAAYDSARGRLVVFGGYFNGRYEADTWEWDGNAWSRSAQTGPAARNNPALVYDARRGRVLLFGGDARPVGEMGDTWERRGEVWRRLDVAGPPARSGHLMVYDSRRDRVVLFGGVAARTGLGDTWEFDGRRWSRVATDGPSPRGLHVIAYDEARGRTVLFGGVAAPGPNAPSLGDTWEWDGRRWTQIDVTGPSARDHAQMAYDPTRRTVVLHGGGIGDASAETWLFDGRAWTRAPVAGPERRTARMVFDTRSRALLLYGGFAREPTNEVWRLGESAWERVSQPGVTATAPAARPAAAAADPEPGFYAIENVSVIPMDGATVLPNQTVIVRSGRIESVAPAGAAAPPAGALRIDGRGKFLFPGLTDSHVHLEGTPEALLTMLLSHGVTTVFNLRGRPEHLTLRSRVAAGEIPGPTIYTSGPYANQPGVMTPDDATRTVREQREAGYDFVKIHGNLTAEAYQAMIAAGRSERMTIIGHAPRNLPFDSVIAAGQPLVVHAEELIYTRFRELDTTAVAAVAARTAAAGIWVTPTLTTYFGIAAQWGRPSAVDSALALPEGAALPAVLQQYWRGSNPYTGREQGAERIARSYLFQLPMVRMLYEAGVPLLAGTDTPLPVMVPGQSLHDEIAQLERAGVPRQSALAAATANAGRFIAKFVDPSARFGTLTAGSRADLLLVDGNPLEDPAALAHPRGVMAQGRWYDRATLDRLASPVAP